MASNFSDVLFPYLGDNKKINYWDVIKLTDKYSNIDKNVYETTEEFWNIMPHYMLHLIMSSHPESRVLNDRPRSVSLSNKPGQPIQFNKWNTLGRKNKKEIHTNPMDVFIYVFRKANPLMRQIIVNQVNKCQLSLPLIIQDPILHKPLMFPFAYQNLTQSCFTMGGQLRSFHVLEEKLNIISFIKIGKYGKSFKSKLMNKLLGFNHSCFFNKDCCGSSKTRLLYDGTIEMNWYLPGGPNDKLFQAPLTFLNLRGNAFDFKTQLAFICKVSTMVGIILSYNDIITEDKEIQELGTLTTKYSDKICLIFTDEEFDIQEANNIGNFLMQLPNFSPSINNNVIISGNLEETAISIRTSIKNTFSQSKSSIKLSIICFRKICKNKKQDILFEDEFLESGIKNCINRFRYFNKPSLSTVMSKLSLEEYLPLQHEVCKNYAQADRRQCKLRIENYIFNKTRGFYEKKFDLTAARKFQLNTLFGKISQNEIALKDFKYIIHDKQNPEDALIMLTLLRIKLEKWKLYFLDSKTINIQHFIRELGQYYELCCDFGDKALNSTRQLVELDPIVLPPLFARLMLLGEPLEIFDGKAQDIPLTWVQDVLSALADELGHDKKVFVLGVIGIQSSGKSTLLNTMFGLQFPVASGRCTRGISIQLISVDSQYACVLNYDYLIILDSEGLRAMEDSNQDLKGRDNEFTTLMIGISDLCIINIMGENFMEWQDIFQTIIISLIKLTSSTICKPKCLFVHQNISDPNAKENLNEGYQKFLLKLDGVTQFISKETKSNPIYTKFTDIIDFDINESIYYLPSLYSTPPPMSIVSKDYVNSAQNFKNDVIFKYGHKTRAITVLAWSVKLKTVWKSILNEDFSSYREIIERIYYNEFGNALHKWSQNYAYEMEKEVLICKDQILNANYEDAMKNFEVYEADIEEKCKTILVSDEVEFKQYYFVTHDEHLIFNSWKTQAEHHFKNTRLDYQIRTKEKLLFLFEIAQRKHKIFNDFCGNRNKILRNATKTKFKLLSDKTKVRDQELCEQFYENEWQNLKSDLKLSEKETTNVNVISLLRNEIYSLTSSLQIENREIEKIKSFYQRFEENNNFLDDFVIGENHYRMFEQDHKEISIVHKYSCWLDYALRKEEIVSVTDFLENILLIKKVIDLKVGIFEACDDYIKEIINQEFSRENFARIIKIIMNSVQEFNNQEKNDETLEIRIQIEKVFIYELALFLCSTLILKLKNKHIVCRDQEMFEEYFEYEWQNWISDLKLLEHEIPCVNFILLLKKEIDTLTSNFEIKNEEMSKIKSFYKRLEQIIYSLDVFIVGEKHYRKFDKNNNEIYSSDKYSCWLDYVLRKEKETVSDTDISEDAPIIIINLIMSIYKECDDYFNAIMNLKFSCVYFVRINRIIINKVQEFNNNKKKNIIACKTKSNSIEIRFQIEKMFIYELTLFLCAKLIIMFKNKHKPNQMDSLKTQLKSQFKHFYNKENYSSSLACANGLANVLLEKMNLHVAEEIQFLVINEFSKYSTSSVSSKCHLQTKVLTDLANESSFNKYWKYIHEPNQAMKDWIIEQFQQFYEHELSISRINAWYKESICKHISSYKEALQLSLNFTFPVEESTLSDVVLENSTINIDWKAQLHKKLEGEHTRQFKLSDLDVLLIEPHEITNSSEFVSFFADSLQKQSDGYIFTSWVETYLMADLLTTFSDTISQNLFYCDEHCPLCNEPCLSNINSSEHKHYCGSFHRPLGLNGWFKFDSEEFVGYDCTNLKNKDESTYMHKKLIFDVCKQMSESWVNSSKHYMIESVYWEWVMCNFKDELAAHYQYKINDKAIKAWSNLTKSQVLNNLQLQMNDFHSPAWRMKK